jgi:hypothetical protein
MRVGEIFKHGPKAAEDMNGVICDLARRAQQKTLQQARQLTEVLNDHYIIYAHLHCSQALSFSTPAA